MYIFITPLRQSPWYDTRQTARQYTRVTIDPRCSGLGLGCQNFTGHSRKDI
jgi:hypothetical protein